MTGLFRLGLVLPWVLLHLPGSSAAMRSSMLLIEVWRALDKHAQTDSLDGEGGWRYEEGNGGNKEGQAVFLRHALDVSSKSEICLCRFKRRLPCR